MHDLRSSASLLLGRACPLSGTPRPYPPARPTLPTLLHSPPFSSLLVCAARSLLLTHHPSRSLQPGSSPPSLIPPSPPPPPTAPPGDAAAACRARQCACVKEHQQPADLRRGAAATAQFRAILAGFGHRNLVRSHRPLAARGRLRLPSAAIKQQSGVKPAAIVRAPCLPPAVCQVRR